MSPPTDSLHRRHSSIPKGLPTLEWFRPELLKHLDDEGVDVALESIQQFVQPDTLSFVLEVALELRGCTELLLSSLSQDRFTFVLNWVDDVFPDDLDSYSPNSICYRLLSTVSVSLLFLQPPNEDDLLRDLNASHQYVVLSNSVLQALVTIIQSPPPEVEGGSSEEEAFPMMKRKKTSQKAQKYARRGRQMTKPVDSTPFRALHLEVPTSHGEAKEMALEILSKQKSVLMSHLYLFRLESLSEILKRNYIPPAVVETVVEDNGAPADRSGQDTEIPEEVPAAYPQVQPMKAALYFDSVEGFGHWQILISGRADRNLREMTKKDRNLFRITLKKIKELSNGHFSDDNHKRLTGTNISVPIYEAKMTRDSRLVYQVDCVPDFTRQVECQAIKVFGIYTHAQLDKRLWDSMGHQLSRNGKEYQKRCTFRAEPIHRGDKVVPPASFPAAPPPDLKLIPDELPTVSDEVLGELHALLVLEKFVAFSQALLTSILADQEVVHVFQVSPHEQEIIEHAHSCFVQGRSGTGKTTTMLFKMLGMENSWQQNRELRPNRPRQLFVTQSRMLADKGGISDLLQRQKNREEAGLVDQDEAVNWREDLPQRFSDLQDTHFPMFITFDKLSAMIEADMTHPPGIVTEDELGASQQAGSSEYMLQRRKSFISFDVFREEYWAHFPQSLTKGIDASLVFSEFMGVIKGSEMTLDSETHFLDYETYLNLSARTQATFASRRKDIYALFETYLKMKRDRREYDAADRTHAILRSMAQDGMKGQKIDFLYVDEVQDNLLIDAKEPSAATRMERMKQQLVQMASPRQPRSFQLVTNFRSHGGIVSCAHSVIVLVTKFWPYAIDILPEEKGIVNGIKPVFFSGWDQDNVRYESFLFGTAGHHIEFGAQQCILVRNDAAREKLRKQVGDIGLIMTLYESKGLEFNDVLLYNFFEDSTVDVSQWRVVLNAVGRAQREKIPAPTFDESRHAGVCSELKFLYVAITRARKNLWIVDLSETAEPMRIYWSSDDLVQNCTPGTIVPQLAVSSSDEEWAKMARTLFSHKRYFQAMHSYERAKMPREKAIAHAYHLREQARGIPVRNRPGDNSRRNAYSEVAGAFMASAQEATILRERSEYYRIAAEAFLVLEDHAKAAYAFEQASKFTEAAQNYRLAEKFDETVSVIQNHGNAMDPSVVSQLTDVARYYYLQRGDLKKASGLFSGPEEELEFVRDCDLDIAEVNILIGGGRFREAADLHIRENRVLDAVEVLLRDKNSGEATHLATQKLLDALWDILSFGVAPDDIDGDALAKLRKIKLLIGRLDLQSLDAKIQQEVGSLILCLVSH
ncbi:P-loop containing nucleoside triphosphate hydrolase protein [Lactarius hengduanensis]|nr:P-loop containing nucleoside triphosphate hydrolase protein [Lactarius hengduanensis]